jgi:hypothetical protein
MKKRKKIIRRNKDFSEELDKKKEIKEINKESWGIRKKVNE